MDFRNRNKQLLLWFGKYIKRCVFLLVQYECVSVKKARKKYFISLNFGSIVCISCCYYNMKTGVSRFSSQRVLNIIRFKTKVGEISNFFFKLS